MFKRLVTTALVFGMACTAPPALAQAVCAQRDTIVAQLETNFAEKPRLAGLESATRIVEFWASDQTGTWTILLTGADGISCIAASGTAWTEFPKVGPANDVGG